jgi:hypothetical protein
MKCNDLCFYEYSSRYQYLFHCTLCLCGLIGFSSKARSWWLVAEQVDPIGVEAPLPIPAPPAKKKR